LPQVIPLLLVGLTSTEEWAAKVASVSVSFTKITKTFFLHDKYGVGREKRRKQLTIILLGFTLGADKRGGVGGHGLPWFSARFARSRGDTDIYTDLRGFELFFSI
jgi:hypothetical protein